MYGWLGRSSFFCNLAFPISHEWFPGGSIYELQWDKVERGGPMSIVSQFPPGLAILIVKQRAIKSWNGNTCRVLKKDTW